jgi:hypothetical protein
MAVLKPDQRAYLLIEVAGSEERIASIEKRIRKTYWRYWAAVIAFNLIGFAAGVVSTIAADNYIGNHYESLYYSWTEPLLLLFGVFYPVSFSIAYIGIRSSPEYRTFSALATCISKVDKAVGKSYASNERKRLAAQVLSCVRAMRSYRPLIPIRAHKRIISKEAIRASQVLKEFVYPAMFGGDRELARLKRNLAQAAINVGTTNWAQVGGVKSITVSRRTNARAVTASLIPVLTIVVPLITALVTAAVSFVPKQSPTPTASTPGPSAIPSGTTPGSSSTTTGTTTPSPQAGSGQ